METESDTTLSQVRAVLGIIGAVLGLCLIGLGIWALGGAIFAAWNLFNDPDSIAYFAKYFLESTKIAAHLPAGGEGVAHYMSWLAVILLLLVLGKLGFWAVSAGVNLVSVRGR